MEQIEQKRSRVVYVSLFRSVETLGLRIEAALDRVTRGVLRVGGYAARPARYVARSLWRHWIRRIVTTIADPLPAEASAGARRAVRDRRVVARNAAVYLLVVLAGVVRIVLDRVDAALQQMHLDTGVAGSALSFPASVSDVLGSVRTTQARGATDAIVRSWQDYDNNRAGSTALGNALHIARELVVLDLAFSVLYALLLVVVIVTLYRANAGLSADDPPAYRQRRWRYGRMLAWAGALVPVLFLLDVAETVQLWYRLTAGRPLLVVDTIALGPLTTLLRLVVHAGIVVPILVVAVAVFVDLPVLRRLLWTTRAVGLAVVLLAVMLFVGVGAAQVDDVIRAWSDRTGVVGLGTAMLLAVIVSGVTGDLSGPRVEGFQPDAGHSSQPLLLVGGLGLLGIGQATRLLGLGWGISVAGGLLLVLWLLGLLIAGFTRRSRSDGPGEGAEPAGPAGHAGARNAGEAARTGESAGAGEAGAATKVCAPPATQLARWGNWLGRCLGGLVLALFVWVIARAIALDLFARPGVHWHMLRWPLAAAIVAMLFGVFVVNWQRSIGSGTAGAAVDGRDRAAGTADASLTANASGTATVTGAADRAVGTAAAMGSAARPAGEKRRPPWPLSRAWFWATAVMFALLVVLWFDRWAVATAETAGTVGVVLAAFGSLIGTAGLIAGLIRAQTGQYQLPPALRVLRLRRFPVVVFILTWALVASTMDRGGFHDIRRHAVRGPAVLPPTIGAAWEQWVSAASADGTKTAAVHPLVLVAAEGGGIRAAVWTALVLECLFGPGPVKGSGDVCAAGSAPPRPAAMAMAVQVPTPVFMASGASGGSLGLAAWSARRADLAQDGAASRTPLAVEDALSHDFVAADAARLFTADLPHAFLQWNRADRAAMLERAWEQAWPGRTTDDPTDPGARGLTRGLRALWNVTHDGTAWGTPVLALNGVSVEDGCRVLASAVDFTLPSSVPLDIRSLSRTPTSADDQPTDAACRGPVGRGGVTGVDVLPTTSELVDYLCPGEDVSLATAAHISARFPYVSPTGRIARTDCPDTRGLVREPAVSFDADGGIFDNSGAGAVTDAWRGLGPLVAAQERQDGSCFPPIFVQIDNSPPASTVSSLADPKPKEVLAPIAATLGQVASRESYARSRAAAAFTRPVSPSGRPVRRADGLPLDALWFRISLLGQPGPHPPLGWTLAPETVSDMRSQLRTRQNADQLEQLRAILADAALTCG